MNSGHISFEGSLGGSTFRSWSTASGVETNVFRCQTISPKLDFVVLPLNEQAVAEIWKELCEKDHLVHEGIIHVQIENGGKLVFGSYDNFHRECTVAYPGVPITLLEELKQKEAILGYRQSNA